MLWPYQVIGWPAMALQPEQEKHRLAIRRTLFVGGIDQDGMARQD
jgi:hypothetical protein